MTPLPKLEEMTDILDLKEMDIWDWDWTVLLVFIVFSLIGLGLALYYLKKRKKRRQPLTIPKTPIQEALGRLQRLVGRGLVESGQIRQFYFNLSEIFRDFLEKELKISATEATLEELRPLLKAITDYTQEEIKESIWLLEISDMAKFAKFIPEKDEIIKTVKSCRVLMTSLARRREIIRQEGHPDEILSHEVAR